MTRDFQRTDRVGSLLQREISSVLHDEPPDPRLGMVTVQEVRVVRDLSQAKVFYTLLENQLSIKESTRVLNDWASHLRWLLGTRVTLRTVPKLLFVYDESVQKGTHLAHLIDQAVADQD